MEGEIFDLGNEGRSEIQKAPKFKFIIIINIIFPDGLAGINY